MEGLYLYGIVAFPPGLSREIRGLGGDPVSLISRQDLAAVVSRSPLNPWPVDEAHLTLHETVVEEVMATRPVLPVRFNTLLRSDEAVIALLDERAQSFRSALERVQGKVEMGLRVLWEPPVEVSADQGIEKKGPGTDYLDRRLREERRGARVRAAGERLIRQIQELFHSLAVESRLQLFPSKRLLLSGAYLVEQDQVEGFRDGVAKAREKFSHLSFLLTGPWPPYHFVNGAKDESTDVHRT